MPRVPMEWRQIPEFPDYEINNMGDLRKSSTGYRPKLQRRSNLYLYSLTGVNGQTTKTVASLMAVTFPELMESGS